jgi:uncharacterized protein involved in exopolysaccharide biosynthesis
MTKDEHAHMGLAPASAGNEDEIDLLQYWQVLRDQRWLVLGILGAVVALALVLTLLATPIYRAQTLVQIERESLQVVNVEGVVPSDAGYYGDDFYQTQYELLQSRSLALRVVQDLNLTEHPLFREHQAQDGATLWDVHVDDLIPSRNYRRVHYGEA